MHISVLSILHAPCLIPPAGAVLCSSPKCLISPADAVLINVAPVIRGQHADGVVEALVIITLHQAGSDN